MNTLRLWAARATRDFDLKLFNEGDFRRAVEEKIDTENISKVLYPNDQSDEGKALRLKQQYFFVTCSIADIVRKYKRSTRTSTSFPDNVAIQLNDTHPSIAVAELMRVLVDQESLEWDVAWSHHRADVWLYQPHAAPRGPRALAGEALRALLPRHLMIIYEINHRFLRKVNTSGPATTIGSSGCRSSKRATEAGAHGAPCHRRLAQHQRRRGAAHAAGEGDLLRDFYELWPERFNNKTNGVTPRRWLLYANPRLHGSSRRASARELDRSRFARAAPDRVARRRRRAFSTRSCSESTPTSSIWWPRCASARGSSSPPTSMFVVQVKRIHEYKRQLLAVSAYHRPLPRLKRDPEADFVPRTYIFAGKAAPGYAMAKLHIKLINDIAAVINSDPEVRGQARGRVHPQLRRLAGAGIIPAADVSLQISTAGKEASGTSNMKFALNGALTLGTLDGANVEIRDEVRPDNFFLFGLDTDEVAALLRHAATIRENSSLRSPALQEALALLESGFFSYGERERFRPIVDNLRYHDPYMICADFDAYVECEEEAAQLYRDQRAWARRAVFNIAGAGRFSSDHTIRQYAEEIWSIEPIKVDLGLIADGV